jgi:hypothetical protein
MSLERIAVAFCAVEAFMMAVAFVVTITAVSLWYRWCLAVGHLSITDFLTRSDDPAVESRRRAFLISILPVVVWSWVMLLVFDP